MTEYVHIRLDHLERYTPEQLEALRGFLGDGRKKIIDPLPEGNHRNLRILASDVLEQELLVQGIPSPKEYGTKENGKPCLVNRPDIDFSISHSGKLVAATVVRTTEFPCVGIDVEDLCRREKSVEELEKLAKRYFRGEEVELLEQVKAGSEKNINWKEMDESLTVEERYRRMFYRIWTWKEARAKALDRPLMTVLKEDLYQLHDPECIQRVDATSVLTVITPGHSLVPEQVLLKGSFCIENNSRQ